MPKHHKTAERESLIERGYHAWREACTSRGVDARVDQRLLWASYSGFCVGSFMPLGRRVFSRWLAEDGVTFRASHGTRWAYGVALRPEAASGLVVRPRFTPLGLWLRALREDDASCYVHELRAAWEAESGEVWDGKEFLAAVQNLGYAVERGERMVTVLGVRLR